MLTTEEHLLVKLAEECAEVTKAAMKALRFGLTDRGPGQTLTNLGLLQDEVIDLYVIVEMLEDRGLLLKRGNVDPAVIAHRREKVERYMAYSRAKGTLAYEPNEAKERP